MLYYSNFRVPSKAKESIQDKDYESILHHQLKQGLGKSSLGDDSGSDSDREEEEEEGRITKSVGQADHVPNDMDEKTEEELLAVLDEYEDRILDSLGKDFEREDEARSRLQSAAGPREGPSEGQLAAGADEDDGGDDDDVLNSLEIDAVVSYKGDEDDDEDDDEDEE